MDFGNYFDQKSLSSQPLVSRFIFFETEQLNLNLDGGWGDKAPEDARAAHGAIILWSDVQLMRRVES